MMKYARFFLIAIVCVLLFSCTDRFSDLNTNQHEVTDEMLDCDNLRVGGFIPQMQRDVIPSSDPQANEYQRAQNLCGDLFSGYMAAIGIWNGCSNNSTYNLFFDWNGVAFEVGFTKVMSAWKSIRDQAGETNRTTFALAQILKVAAMHRVTDCYGPIPYSDFGNGGMTTAYDSQEAVYTEFFKELNEAIEILHDFVMKTPTARPLKKFDLVYDGDFSKWLKFANSLKLRLALRIVYVKPEIAKQYAEEAVRAGVMTQNADNALLHSANGIIIYHPLKRSWDDYADIRMGATMESFLSGYNDDRQSKYFYASEGGGYHGARNGLDITSKAPYTVLSTPAIETNTPLQWMCAAEVYFLRAEAALRKWDVGGTPQGLYEEGIKMSFAQWNATLGVYLTNSSSEPAPYVDQIGKNNYAAIESKITIKWDESAGFESNLERIITQKWIATYPDGQEAWSELRRTGYPKIIPVVNNYSGGSISSQEGPCRIPFPPSERLNNKKEVAKAEVLLGGIDNGGTKLWWDKK